jgi:hypothetical protein
MIQCNSGVIMDKMRGDGANKLMGRRRLEIVNGNILAYCLVLNSKDHLEHTNEVPSLTSSVAEVTNEKVFDRKRLLENMKQDEGDKNNKNAEKRAMANELHMC